MGVESLTDIASSKGKDLQEIFEKIKRENELAEQLGISLPQKEDAVTIAVQEDDDAEI